MTGGGAGKLTKYTLAEKGKNLLEFIEKGLEI